MIRHYFTICVTTVAIRFFTGLISITTTTTNTAVVIVSSFTINIFLLVISYTFPTYVSVLIT